MAGLGSRRGPFKPGDVRANPVKPPMCLPPMAQRAAKAAVEQKPKRRDKAHEERLVLESALAYEPLCSSELPAKPLTVECHEGPIHDVAEDSDRLLLRLLRKGVLVAEIQLDPSLTVQEVKEGLAKKLGTAPQDQRFFWRMQCLPDYSTFRSCGLTSGEHNISLIPEISHRATGVSPICARRGMNMVPSGPSLPWKPSKFSKIRHEDLQLYFGDVAPLTPLELEDAQALRQQVWQVPDVTVAKSTNECLSAAVEGGKTHAAFVFIKPHAVCDKVKTLVKEKLTGEGLTIKSEGQIKSTMIDQKKLIDTHYGAIAAKAVEIKPKELTVQDKAQHEFEKQFGVKWSKVMEDGLVYNAIDGAKKLGITPDELGKKYDALKKGEGIIKFGGGFYCGKVDGVYVINGFYMKMRSKFTAPGTSIYYYEVEWPAEKMSWGDFRGKLLGPTDPASAPVGSLRQQIYSKWFELGLKAQPDTGDNGVHASASPFEALAERNNWLGTSVSEDAFGKALLANGIPLPLTKEWFSDPAVDFEGGKKSLFDLLEDLDAAACLKKCKEIAVANKK